MSRLDYAEASPEAYRAMAMLEKTVRGLGLDERLLELVKIRASQLNGCAFCLDMHALDARALGESEQRIVMLSVWREAERFYSPRERAALAWTEALTRMGEAGVSDEVYEATLEQFSPAELTNLTLAVVAINGWNRFGVGFRREPGDYRPSRRVGAEGERLATE